MQHVLTTLINAREAGRKLFAILIDPDKIDTDEQLVDTMDMLNASKPDMIFIGGSMIKNGRFELVAKAISQLDVCPTVIFPGNNTQISSDADAILLLSLISGRNPEFLIGQHVMAAHELKRSKLDIIPTGYILVDCGHTSTTQYVSNTTPIPHNKTGITCATALAGEQLGMQVIYLEGGSGAKVPISTRMITEVRNDVKIPLIVGGGIRSLDQAEAAWDAGADLIVIGSIFEENPEIGVALSNLKNQIKWNL